MPVDWIWNTAGRTKPRTIKGRDQRQTLRRLAELLVRGEDASNFGIRLLNLVAAMPATRGVGTHEFEAWVNGKRHTLVIERQEDGEIVPSIKGEA